MNAARTRSRRPILAVTAALALTLVAGCTASGGAPGADGDGASSTTATQPSAASHPLIDGLGATAVVDTLEALPVAERPDDLMVSVRPDMLVVTDAYGEREQPLPDDLFYLSVAPYLTSNHDCYFHSLTTCRGELGGAVVQVRAVSDDGQTLLDETRTAADNGFVGLWLPRDISGTLTLTVDGSSATADFSTGADDPTCVTTMQLA